jgi:GT2 family glycosyltransferase
MSRSVAAVIITMGTRPAEFSRALESLRAQQGIDLDIVVVGNSWQPVGLPPGVKAHFSPVNLGIPGGRTAGTDLVVGDYLFYLDDDAWLPTSDVISRMLDILIARPDVGIVQPRATDPITGETPSRCIPRLIAGDPARASVGTTLWEGAGMLLPRATLERAGGWADEFFYAHEGMDLCWRIWDGGQVSWYAADIITHHNAVSPARHAVFWFQTARNRVWVAKRNLPWPLVPLYLATWVAITTIRARSLSSYRAWWRGFFAGIRSNPQGRRAMSWQTVWRLTRAGRPPII